MITNLFSIFDPSTPSFLSSNWASSMLFLALVPISLWVPSSPLIIPFQLTIKFLLSEFKPLVSFFSYRLLLVVSLFIFIIFNNTLGLIPYIFTSTRHLSTSLSLVLPYWIALIFYTWINNLPSFFAHLTPKSTPLALVPFIVVIETISILIRPITLAIRLSANMIAGHLLLSLLRSSFMALPMLSYAILVPSLVSLSLLETAVALIQAYVFRVLITLYLSETSN